MFEPDPILTKPDLSHEDMSIDELTQRIADLKAEIIDCEKEIEKKKAQKDAANALFGN